ncbi:MAG TPA: methyltransferase domain-containing protein [Burkholderiales bacterium]|nr:methyltransferase domain-containing protein [Burkholderiales bacterium]
MSKPNSQYSLASPMGLPDRIAMFQRKRMYARFLRETGVVPNDTILDVGATNDRNFDSSNYLEAWYPYKDRITAVGTDDASCLERMYPGLKFVRADGVRLPFRDAAFDIVHSSAVLEHVGAFERQLVFVRECARVARKAVFLTTPNRWFPVEFHTQLPLAHWLPKSSFRGFLRRVGLAFFSEEANLNLLSRADLARIARRVRSFRFEIDSVSLCAWPSNLLLIGHCEDKRTESRRL